MQETDIIQTKLSSINKRLVSCVGTLEEVQMKILRRDRQKAEERKQAEIEQNKSQVDK